MKNHTIGPTGTHTEPAGATDAAACMDCTPSDADVSDFRNAIRAIVGKWKLEILCALMDGGRRFGELRRCVPGITQHMLTAQLRDLESHGLVLRTAHAEIPPRVEYELTEAAYALEPAFEALVEWSRRYGKKLDAAGSARAVGAPATV